MLKEMKGRSTLWQRLLAIHQKSESFFPGHMVGYIFQPPLQLDVAMRLIYGIWGSVTSGPRFLRGRCASSTLFFSFCWLDADDNKEFQEKGKAKRWKVSRSLICHVEECLFLPRKTCLRLFISNNKNNFYCVWVIRKFYAYLLQQLATTTFLFSSDFPSLLWSMALIHFCCCRRRKEDSVSQNI